MINFNELEILRILTKPDLNINEIEVYDDKYYINGIEITFYFIFDNKLWLDEGNIIINLEEIKEVLNMPFPRKIKIELYKNNFYINSIKKKAIRYIASNKRLWLDFGNGIWCWDLPPEKLMDPDKKEWFLYSDGFWKYTNRKINKSIFSFTRKPPFIPKLTPLQIEQIKNINYNDLLIVKITTIPTISFNKVDIYEDKYYVNGIEITHHYDYKHWISVNDNIICLDNNKEIKSDIVLNKPDLKEIKIELYNNDYYINSIKKKAIRYIAPNNRPWLDFGNNIWCWDLLPEKFIDPNNKEWLLYSNGFWKYIDDNLNKLDDFEEFEKNLLKILPNPISNL